jgi:glyoxylase-like metal-dependent hydrolase (beta-lactamase superfamily II)
MKKLLLASILVSTSLLANMYTFEPINITKDTTCFIGDFNPPMKQNKGFVSNVCYVDIGDSIVVIEPGPTYNFAKELVAHIKTKTTKKISYVIATNFHDDRYTGASFYKEKNIPIIAHKTIVKELKENPDKFSRIPKVTTKDEYKNSKIVQPDILTEGKYIIQGSRINIEVLKLSAGSNSVSDIAVYVPKDDFIFAGNIVFNGRMIKYAKYSNIDNWIEALKNLEKMDAKFVLGGHGLEYDKDSYKPTLEYLNILKSSVKEAYENDVDREELSQYVYDKKFNHYKHFDSVSKANPKIYYDQLEWAE